MLGSPSSDMHKKAANTKGSFRRRHCRIVYKVGQEDRSCSRRRVTALRSLKVKIALYTPVEVLDDDPHEHVEHEEAHQQQE